MTPWKNLTLPGNKFNFHPTPAYCHETDNVDTGVCRSKLRSAGICISRWYLETFY